MPPPPAPAAAEFPSSEQAKTPRQTKAPAPSALGVADLGIVALFLGLAFLLGIFPLNDTDFWWHLRTGDLIRQDGKVPRTDWYTFGASDHAWIDLHWGFQVAISWLYQMGGVDATNVAKCVVTTCAVAFLLLARRKSWPIWVMALSWIPALLLLGGRMYVRPETLTLLYLSIDLAVLFRIETRPRLAWVLPIVQVFWVNTQGLFAFGPIVLTMALIDAALRPGAFSTERRGWWRTILAATFATGFACLLNPYGLFGALFPLQLVGTMGNPVFRRIMELQPILDFVKDVGFDSLPLQIHFVTLILGALSFLIPLSWRVMVRFEDFRKKEPEPTRKRKKPSKALEEPGWRLSPFRLMLYSLFSYLSFQATRNSHQFAAVVGTVTAWNFGEWAAAIAYRRGKQMTTRNSRLGLLPRLAVMATLVATIGLVGSGQFYVWANEGRQVGWGEKPLWYPHEATKFAGSPGMPERFLVFHNGHAGLFEYDNGPKQKVHADARLEVMGPEVYGADAELGAIISSGQAGWSDRVMALGSPVPGALVDHVQPAMAGLAASYLANSSWRCVWYDPIASVYLHESTNPRFPKVDFAARHFGLDPGSDPKGAAALSASAKGLMLHAMSLTGGRSRPDLSPAMILLGLGHGRRALALDPQSASSWKSLGLLETLRDPAGQSEPIARFRKPFDPLFDLPQIRTTYNLLQADRLARDEFMTLIGLFKTFALREMNEAAAPIADRLIASVTTREQERYVTSLAPLIGRVKATMMRPLSTSWSNLGELEQTVARLLNDGYAQSAADLLEKAYAPAVRTWEQTDRIATLRLHLGQTAAARSLWKEAVNVPRPAVRDARMAVTYLVEGDFESARGLYEAALKREPDLFEAAYGLAVLEQDAGRADPALAAALVAVKTGSTDVARSAASQIAEFVRPYTSAARESIRKSGREAL